MSSTFNGFELLPPGLPQLSHDGIGLLAASHLVVRIEPYACMEEGDLLELFWGERFVTSRFLNCTDVDYPIFMRVPESFAESGVAHIHYQVMKIGISPLISPVAHVTVKLDCPGGIAAGSEENQYLAPLSLPVPVKQCGVSLSHIKRGVPVAIEPYLNMAEGDAITLRWGDLRLDLPALQGRDVDNIVHARVPKAMVLEGGRDERLEVTYCVIDRVGNASGWAPACNVRVFCAPMELELR
ncbi:MAG: hypothetical protein PW845_23770 [Pseudomonas sp.]|uniref:hypothetical protein n=1 Tax=Pseudomonas abieticivorans TaxID=2931382 RepID=UPI0020BDCDBE|nr:hypothetical protein [Pseudomonas sp. PIA16]MDE1168314.1 hypothetical protein [Pseudomonas sp.]